MFIQPVPEHEAPPAVADMYSADRAAMGFLPGYTQVFSHHPDAYGAWRQLISSIRGQMDARRCELVTLAAARALRSSYCSTAHGKILAERWYDPDTVRQLVVDHSAAGLEHTDVVLMDFATKVATDPTAVTADDVDRLRQLGLSERDILDVVLAVAARCFFATVVEALYAGPDRPLIEAVPEGLREVLLVGRSPA
ncbi:MAG TPA: peroxidase-related enzyme [Acidimicrobiia bacterium]|nr:peroxidase-related enzyme [Acidimicrobiia bacterium]